MLEKIRRHREERPNHWQTLEEPFGTGARGCRTRGEVRPTAGGLPNDFCRESSAGELGRLHEVAFGFGVATIVDEAFIEYAPEESLSQRASESPGLIVLRSLTKFFGMPGVRVAYAVSHPEMRAAIETFVPAWPVESIAAEAARLALQGQDSIAATRGINARERRWLADRLHSLGLKVFPSAANYLWLKPMRTGMVLISGEDLLLSIALSSDPAQISRGWMNTTFGSEYAPASRTRFS
jgi:hypothetical protein